MVETLLLVIALPLTAIAVAQLKMAFGTSYHSGWLKAKKGNTEKEEKPDLMDEGFENIMRFSVMGNTGFENGANEWQ